MILLLASQFDQQASRLAGFWAKHEACVMTARDLSQEGWVFSPDGADQWIGKIGDRTFGPSDLAGVLNCVPEVSEQELGHIVAEDRAYVAAEMNAFLLSWQSQLSCPIVNRPTPGCLCGPAWRLERWILTAAALGIPVNSVQRSSRRTESIAAETLEETRSVTVIGDVVMADDSEIERWARLLARAARVTVATFYFGSTSQPNLAGVSPRANLDDHAVQDALLQCFEVSTPC